MTVSLTPLILGTHPAERQIAYQALFANHIPEHSLDEIRHATNKAWVLGDHHFKQRIEQLLNRRAQAKPRGGDRRSAEYRKNSVEDIYLD